MYVLQVPADNKHKDTAVTHTRYTVAPPCAYIYIYIWLWRTSIVLYSMADSNLGNFHVLWLSITYWLCCTFGCDLFYTTVVYTSMVYREVNVSYTKLNQRGGGRITARRAQQTVRGGTVKDLLLKRLQYVPLNHVAVVNGGDSQRTYILKARSYRYRCRNLNNVKILNLLTTKLTLAWVPISVRGHTIVRYFLLTHTARRERIRWKAILILHYWENITKFEWNYNPRGKGMMNGTWWWVDAFLVKKIIQGKQEPQVI